MQLATLLFYFPVFLLEQIISIHLVVKQFELIICQKALSIRKNQLDIMQLIKRNCQCLEIAVLLKIMLLDFVLQTIQVENILYFRLGK